MATLKKSQILIVDDYPTNIKVLSDLLIEYGFEVLIARDGENALQKLQRICPDIILLDVLMPGIDGFETCARLKEQESTRQIPIIFMTALSDPVDKIKGLTLGAVDYITKPFQQEEVLARVNTHLKLRHLTKQLEEQNAQLQEEARSRQLAELALRMSEEKFAKAFRSNPGPMMILTLQEGRFIEINQNFCKILGYLPEMILGKTFSELKFCVNPEEGDRFFAELRDTGAVQHQELQLYTRSGDVRILTVSAEVIHVKQIPCILAMTLDITECKRATLEMQKAKAMAEFANQAKSRFLANISHELRTPLSTILGYTQLMNRDTTLKPEQQEHLNIINRSGAHLLTLINDVLEMTKIESGQMSLNRTKFDLCTLLADIYEMLKPKAQEKALQFTFQLDANVPQLISTDATKLRQVLINIIGNGIKFTEQGGVTLRVSLGDSDNQILGQETSTDRHPGESTQILVFEITDTGPGIASDEIQVLFDPFIQTETGRRSQEGTGLGLPISQRFVQLMGGDIKVCSTVGSGSVFTFEIQATVVDRADVPVFQPRRQVIGIAPGQPNYRILVVDDQVTNRQLFVKLLNSVGFDVREAENGEIAIELYQNWQPHLIWMDVRMPVMDGYEATRHIKQLQAERERIADRLSHPSETPVSPKIIALTANAFEEERLAALAAGYDDFIRKPIQEEILFEKIAEHLGIQYFYREEGSDSPHQSNRESEADALPFSINNEISKLLWDMVDGDQAFLESYLASHLETMPQLMQTLKTAVAQQNAIELSLAAHSLKGMGMTFQARRFSELCQAIESVSNSGDPDIPAKQLLQLEAELEQVIIALRTEYRKIRANS